MTTNSTPPAWRRLEFLTKPCRISTFDRARVRAWARSDRHGQADLGRRPVGPDRAAAAGTEAPPPAGRSAEAGPAARVRPAGPDRHPVRAADGHPVGVPAGGDGVRERDD